MSYRKIWQKHYGPIPKDELGRSYDIHHIDGNRRNNELNNLYCCSLQEHFEIHLTQGDYAAAFRIAQRMQLDQRVKSELMSRSNLKRIQEGNHPFVDPEVRKKAAKTHQDWLEKKIHPFQNKTKEEIEKAKKTYAANHNRSSIVKKSWEKYKQDNPNNKRTLKGSKIGATKTKGTKWYHKQNGEQLRIKEDDPRIKAEGWLLGRFKLILQQ